MIYLKSNADIAIMRDNGKILTEIFKKLKNTIKAGITTKDIDTVVESIIYSRFAEPSFKGYRGFPAASCVSPNAEVVHGIPGEYVLKDGDIVGVDVGAFKNGFHVDAARTYAVGAISAEAERLVTVTRESFFKGVEQAVIGNRVSDISAAVQRYVEAAGFNVVRDMQGHGIGRSVHEDPRVPNFGMPGKGPKLRAGMVLAVEPMVSQGDFRIVTEPNGWTVVTKDGKLSAHYENTLALTDSGPEILTLDDGDMH
ncbi:MAG: type I methionyl aminopeptidase [Deferribacteraceae bacterium]|jgi:methionyl aminopeptidase|nr:type I methionyl aminopeptidase [Deferribacteraceae bacterium]